MKTDSYIVVTITISYWSEKMKTDVIYWEHIILSGKTIEPLSSEQQASFEIAQFLISRENKPQIVA